MSFIVIIPARYASTRLPGKPLMPIAGKPMVQHVYERACASQAERVIVATDDERVVKACRDFGAETVLTASHHPSGTDRLQEAASLLQLNEQQIVVNVQGDEPLIPPAVIDQVADCLARAEGSAMATLAEPITEPADIFNPNCVKLALSRHNKALYFSRAPIPWLRGWGEQSFAETSTRMPEAIPYLRHLGIYAYRVAFLNRFVTWPVSALEEAEKLEQLRALAEGETIDVAICCEDLPPGVDTEQDLERLRRWFDEQD